MARYREPFSIYPRHFKNNTTYYYRTYDKNGHRTSGISTGQTTKTAARAFCQRLLKEEKLLFSKYISFNEYAKNWWIYDKCKYIKSRIERGGSFSPSHADNHRRNMEKHILPVFSKYKLEQITSGQIEKWLFSFKDNGLSNTTANHNLETLRIMLNEAFRLQFIKHNPIKAIKPLIREKKEKSILNPHEIKKLFDMNNYNENWDNYFIFCINILSACTGIRLGEAQALQVENVFNEYIRICNSLDRKYGLKDTKTHDIRNIPIPFAVSQHLVECKRINNTGFIFSNNGGKTPIYHKTITKGLNNALLKIGISKEERKSKNITFHSWRHFFNTTFRTQIPDSILQELTGHKTAEMTDHYTHFNIDDFKDVKAIQESLFF